MKRTLSELIFADCLFILFLSLSVFLPGIFGTLFYGAAFAVPVLLLLLMWKKEKTEVFGISVLFSPHSMKLTALWAFPIIFAVILTSFLTSLLMGAIGIETNAADYSGNIFYVIAVSALAPAIFEEMLFRYLPLRGLGAESPRLAVIYSSILFALAHCNLFQIPYALIAGVAFAVLDIISGSVLPSILIHFVNNILSIIWQRNSENNLFLVIFLTSISLLAAISIVVNILKRKELKKEISLLTEDKSKLIFTYPLVLYIFVTLVGATISLAF